MYVSRSQNGGVALQILGALRRHDIPSQLKDAKNRLEFDRNLANYLEIEISGNELQNLYELILIHIGIT